MSQTIERRYGAVSFTKPGHHAVPQPDATVFAKSEADFSDPGWDEVVQTVCEFANLEDDWDGEQSVAPAEDLIYMAATLARQLKASSNPAPMRVVPGVNGTITFEFGDELFTEIEVITPRRAEVYEAGKLVSVIEVDQMT